MPNPTASPLRRALRSCLPLLAVALLPLAPLTAAAQPASPAPALAPALAPVRTAAAAHPSPAAGQPIDTSDRAAVTAAYRDVYLPGSAVTAPTPSEEDVSSCNAGTTSTGLQDATLQLVNYFRDMSQVPPVTFDPALSAKAQQAALMMYANQELSHTPPSTWGCYSADGAEAAGSSNLGLGYTGADVVAGYMTDDGDGNTEAGHRWWLQRPAARVMGSGTFGTANALWVMPTADDVTTSEPAFTSWPSPGYFPAPLEPGGRWSFSPTDPSADLSAATVSVSTGGTSVPATAYPIGRFSSLVFEVGQLTAPTGSAVTTYDVTVSGVRLGDQPVEPYRYSVRMVDPTVQPTPPPPPPLAATTAPVVGGSVVVGSTLTVTPPRWNRTGVVTTYRWLRDGLRISGATARTYRLGTADVGHRISVQATGTASGEHAVSTSARTATVTKIRSVLTLSASSPAVGRVKLAVRLTVGGARATGVVRVRDGSKTVARALKVTRGVAAYAGKAKPGRHSYTVSYAGSARVTSAKATRSVQVRDKAAAHVTASGGSTTPNKVTFSISVTASGHHVSGGSVKITRGSTTVVKKVALHGGSARYTAKKQPKGRQTYTLTYGGTSSTKRASVRVSVTVKAAVTLRSFASCDDMDAVYPHGVGKSGATDSSSSTPVTNFYRSNALYAVNDGGPGEHDLDRDNDGIACERL